MDDEVFELVNEEIFDNLEQATAIACWLVHLLGGKVVFPVDEDFWDTNLAESTRLVLLKEDGKLVLTTQVQKWVNSGESDE